MSSETNTPNPINCVLGKGRLYLARHSTAGVRGGYREIGNAKELRASPQIQSVDLANYLTSDGGTYASAEVSKAITVSFTAFEIANRGNLALITSGTEGAYTQAATAVTGEALSSALALGDVYFTAKRQIGTVAVKQGMTTLVAGTDYEIVDANAGAIKILTTGAATEGSAVTVDYTPTAITGTNQRTVEMYAAGAVQCSLIYLASNSYGGLWEMRYWKLVLQPGDLAGLLGDDFGSSDLALKVMHDGAGDFGGSASSPYGRAYRR